MGNRGRKLAGILFCAAMIAGLLSGAARADAEKTVAGLGTDAIPDQGKVWFGAYAADANQNKEPVSWIAMKDGNVEGKYRLLVSEYLLGSFAFNAQNINNKWIDSMAQVFCTDFYENSYTPDRAAFSEKERSAIAKTNKSDDLYKSSPSLVFDATNNILDGDHVFFLSAEEAESFFPDNKSRIAKYKDGGEYRWWLRSPVSGSGTAVGIVNAAGTIDQWECNGWYPGVSQLEYCGVRPAFNLKQSAVLFSSGSGTGEYKFTLYDSGSSVMVSGTITRDSENPFITVPYGIFKGTANHISLLITNGEAAWKAGEGWSDSAVIKSYEAEAKAVNEFSGSVTFSLPENFDANRDSLKVWLLAEQVTGPQETDFASGPEQITDDMIPHRHAFRFSAGTGAESNTVRAKCTRGSDVTKGLTVILSAPENAVYDGQPKAAALNTDYDTAIVPHGPYAIQYCVAGDTSWSGTAPTDAGTYEASVQVEGETARVAFTN